MRVDNSSHILSSFHEHAAGSSLARSTVDDRQSTDFQRELASSRRAPARAGFTPQPAAPIGGATAKSTLTTGGSSISESDVPDAGTATGEIESASVAAPESQATAAAPQTAGTFQGLVEAAIAAEKAMAEAAAPAASSAKAVSAAADKTETTMAAVSGSSTTELDPSPAAPWPMTLVTPANPPSLAGESKDALSGALQLAGIDPATVKVSYWEELVWFPGGNWINRSITVQTPNGQKMDFDAAATLRSPYVTANSVQQMMNA